MLQNQTLTIGVGELFMVLFTTFLCWTQRDTVNGALLLCLSVACLSSFVFNIIGVCTNSKAFKKWFGVMYSIGSAFMLLLIAHVSLIWILEHLVAITGVLFISAVGALRVYCNMHFIQSIQ